MKKTLIFILLIIFYCLGYTHHYVSMNNMEDEFLKVRKEIRLLEENIEAMAYILDKSIISYISKEN